MKSTESNFIHRLKSEKEDALEYVVDNYLPLIKGVSYKVLSPLKNDGMIDECINDIFLSIWHHAKDFNGDTTDFKKWICIIAKFKAIDYYRKATRNMEVSSEQMELQPADSIEKSLILAENRNELMQLIHKLDPIDQQIFIMRFFLGESTEAIAKKLGKTKASVDNRIYRGKKRLNGQVKKFLLGGSYV